MAETFKIIAVDDYNGSTSTTTNISDGTLCRVVNFYGRGIPPVQWNLISSSGSFGSTFDSFKLEPRKIILDLVWTAATASAAVTTRESLYTLFAPFSDNWFAATTTNDVGKWLEVTREDASVRRIKFHVEGAMDVPYVSEDPFSNQISGKVRVSLTCPYPIWFDPTPYTASDTTMSGAGSGSFSIPVTGTTWFMYPVFTLTGPATAFGINQVKSSPGLDFDSAITGSETITIDFRPFAQTITDQTGAYRYDLLDNTSYDFMHSYVPPYWFNDDSANVTQGFTYSGGSGATQLDIEMYKQYLGI